ncbi:MAG: TadE/TadG family type IV pilus assembly protein [Actinomycetota bacterium]
MTGADPTPGPTAARAERGSATVELTLITIPIVLLVAFAVFVGRYASTYQEVGSAARDAARAAAVRQDPAAARQAGEEVAATTLATRGISCRSLTVTVDTAALAPGGQVEATVACTVSLSDLGGFGLPGTVEVDATSVAVVDTYRGGE